MRYTEYQIKVQGQLDPRLAGWFGDFGIDHTPEGDTLLTGTVSDQAALYGVLTRCRDMGLTLIALNPSPTVSTSATETREEKHIMNKIRVEAAKVIAAHPEAIYAVISDYKVGHAAILPKPYFTSMTIEQGGQGTGTQLYIEMNVYGSKKTYRQIVSEPEPGRVIVESDLDSDLVTSFTLKPLADGQQTEVTITTEFTPSPGIAGWMERRMNPPIMRRIYHKELQQLADYVTSIELAN